MSLALSTVPERKSTAPWVASSCCWRVLCSSPRW
ncbi:hypothetical protein HNP46_006721 [Pseudomonas nitritireducens]|uniref:Uncharacterized protein n=1 Tax=Pseudomonas nitroreducens TaxID=46680 RepID=A0A7W7P5Z4_PSENT|nr:hypothetical protein [Pseudomonas nitritireducens]